MDTSLIRCLLPEEIMHLILGYLQDESDIKHCRLVCSNWNSTLCSMYYKGGIHVDIGGNNRCELLKEDLILLPKLATRIQKISINDISLIPLKTDSFMSILKMCTHIEKLDFNIEQTGVKYLLILLGRPMPNPSLVKEINVDNINLCSPFIRTIHLLINLIYRNTITSLEISDIKKDENNEMEDMYRSQTKLTSTLSNEINSLADVYGTGYHGLISYVSKFPNLKVLKLLPTVNVDVIDLSTFMDPSICRLETLHISGDHLTLIIQDTPNHWPKINSCKSITELDIRVKEINVNTLEYIMHHFTHLEKLSLYPSHHLLDYQNSSFQQTESYLFMAQFTCYCQGIKDTRICLVYETVSEDGKIVPRQVLSQYGRLIDLGHGVRSCCPRKLPMRRNSLDDYDAVDEYNYYFGEDDDDSYYDDDGDYPLYSDNDYFYPYEYDYDN